MATPAGRQASLLRGINVGGANKVAMSALREIYAALGGSDVRTYVQSGNVVFTHAEAPATVSRLARQLIKQDLGLDIAVIGRTAAELRRVADRGVFPDAASNRHFVVFLDADPNAEGLPALRAVAKADDVLELHGRELHMLIPEGIGQSKLTLPLIEKRLGASGTTRNWNTVLKLAELTAHH